MRYGYICTNYNNSHYSIVSTESLLQGSMPPEVIVIVDNDSSPLEVEKLLELKARFPSVELVLNKKNVGYFAGLNDGIAAVAKYDLDCCVIGNNDLEFPPEFGEALTEVVREHFDEPVISPQIVTLDGFQQNPHVISGISRVREFVYDLFYSNFHLAKLIRFAAQKAQRVSDRHDEEQFAVAQHIYQGHGSCYVMTRRFFAEFGKLWAPTFMMGEEFFLSRQLSDKGYRVYYDPRIRIRHRCNGALEKLPARRSWEMARSAHRVYRRYVKPWHRQGR